MTDADHAATIARLEHEYQRACCTIASMHAAAVRSVRGPIRGLIEDVADLRTRADAAEKELRHVREAWIAARQVVFAARGVVDWFSSDDEPHINDHQSAAIAELRETTTAYDQRNHASAAPAPAIDRGRLAAQSFPPGNAPAPAAAPSGADGLTREQMEEREMIEMPDDTPKDHDAQYWRLHEAAKEAEAHYLAEIKRLEAAASPAEAGRWIACSERTPLNAESVMVCEWFPHMSVVEEVATAWYHTGRRRWIFKCHDEGLSVTHWMRHPLPPAPAQAGEGKA